MNITDTWLKKMNGEARTKTEIFNDDKREGLSARISPKGKITFQYRYYSKDKITGKSKQQRMDLGSYPKTGIAAARTERDRLAEFLDRGENPSTIKKTENTNKLNRGTVADIFNAWFESTGAKKRKSSGNQQSRVNNWIVSELGELPFDLVEPTTWLKLMEKNARIRPEVTRALLSELRLASKWAKKAGLIREMPIAEFSAKDFGIVRQHRDRVIQDWEMALIYQALENSNVHTRNRCMFHLAIFFGCRISELRLAERSHFDLSERIWTVPAKISKTGKDIKRPIIDEIVPEIRFAMDLSKSKRWLFPKSMGEGAGDTPNKPNFQITIPGNLNHFINTKYLTSGEKVIEHWTTHDLRRTARTNWEQMKIEERVSEKMLGHLLQGVLKHYNHYDYLEEMATAYRQWFYRLEQIQGRAKNITPLVRPAVS